MPMLEPAMAVYVNFTNNNKNIWTVFDSKNVAKTQKGFFHVKFPYSCNGKMQLNFILHLNSILFYSILHFYGLKL